VTYIEWADRLNQVLDQRRRISTSKYGLLPQRGKEKEHEWLTREAEEIRKEMRRIRYGKE
jgi:predicted transcriptional regulator